MYAVVEIAGKQYTVAPKDTLLVPTLKRKAGASVTFDRVFLLGSDKEIRVGNPVLAGARVEGTVLEQVRGEKTTVFKKKRRKGFKVTRGHRQGYTKIQITSIAR